MPNFETAALPVAVRVYPESKSYQKEGVNKSREHVRPDAFFVFDTETRTDSTQKLIFGNYRFIESGRCLEEGLFHADDLPNTERQILEDYVARHEAETVDEGMRELRLLRLPHFLDIFFHAAYKSRCLLIGFNLPFDLSRIARDATTARGRFAGGFSLDLWSYIDRSGHERSDKHRPRIGIKHIDSKRALKGFTARKDPDSTDLIPEGSVDGKPEKGYVFRGHFLDLRTLGFALTDKGYSLEQACEAFGVENGKSKVSSHGVVTEEYIEYNRRDVAATSELAIKLLEEYDKHPVELQVTKAYSPASVGKAYLRAMGIIPIVERQPDFPREYLGFAQSSFFGGRTSAHIRKAPVPVIYTDFLSMYPTVNSLMDLWRFVIAEEIHIVEHCQAEIQRLLNHLTAEQLFNPDKWKELTGMVQIIPDDDILPHAETTASRRMIGRSP